MDKPVNGLQETKEILKILEPSVEALGYDIIRVSLSKSQRAVLQVMIERQDGQNVTLDDCCVVSRTVSVLLEVEDPLKEAYILEVSSPGLDRPLIKRKDYERFCGQEVKIQSLVKLEGRRRFQGILACVDADGVRVRRPEGPDVFILWDHIKQCRLVPYFENGGKRGMLVKGKKG